MAVANFMSYRIKMKQVSDLMVKELFATETSGMDTYLHLGQFWPKGERTEDRTSPSLNEVSHK